MIIRISALRYNIFLVLVCFPYRKSWPRQNRVHGALDHGQRPLAIYCAMCAAPCELPFGSPCDTEPRWKILSSFLGAAADFDVRGKIKGEASTAVSSESVAGVLPLRRAPPPLEVSGGACKQVSQRMSTAASSVRVAA